MFAPAASRAAVSSSGIRSGPVLTKPLASSATHPSKPRGIGHGSGHEKDVPDIVHGHVIGLVITPVYPLEMRGSLERDNLGVRMQSDRRSLFDSSNRDTVTCVSARPFARTSMCTRLRRLREKHRGLTGRVAAADDDDLLAGAQLRLHERGVVVDASSFELREILERMVSGNGRRWR